MEFDHSFSVAAPIDAVWAAMTDIERIVPCVPNARVTGRAGADGYDVEVTIAVGPLETTAECRITLVERDDATHREVLRVRATDSDGDMPADATITIVLTQATDRQHLAVSGVVALDERDPALRRGLQRTDGERDLNVCLLYTSPSPRDS